MAIFGPFSALENQLPALPGFSVAAGYVRRCLAEGTEERQRLMALATGISQRVELEGGVFALEEAYLTKPESQGRWESHYQYIDVQVVIEGEEIMDVIDVSRLSVEEDLTPARDILFYQPLADGSRLRIAAGMAAVFFPVDAHRPALAVAEPAHVRKVVVKIPVPKKDKALRPSEFRNDPLIWRAACDRILNSINVLKRGAANATDIERDDASLTAMMLAGFAFENAFKAKVLRDGGLIYQDGKMQGFRHHEFVKWAEDYGIAFQGWEREALDKAEFFCVAWGRYPAHNRVDRERPFETWGWSDVDQLKTLIHRLNN